MAVAPTVMPVEVAAAIGAAARAGRIDPALAPTAHRHWAELAEAFDLRVVDVGLAEAARRIAELGAVRGMDAIYLAVAAELEAPGPAFAFATFDTRQRAAALAAGLAVLPAWTAAERQPT